MPTDSFNQIKQAVADLIEQHTELPAYTDRYLDSVTDQRFAVVYIGDWSEEQTGEITEVNASLHVEVFAMNDGELSRYVNQLRPLLKMFDSDLVAEWQPSGGEYTPEEKGIRPSVILSYSVSFDEL